MEIQLKMMEYSFIAYGLDTDTVDRSLNSRSRSLFGIVAAKLLFFFKLKFVKLETQHKNNQWSF